MSNNFLMRWRALTQELRSHIFVTVEYHIDSNLYDLAMVQSSGEVNGPVQYAQ